MTADMAEFLAARLGEDEMMAHAVTAAHGMHSGSDLVIATNQPDFDDFRPICDFDPARVLREAGAGRKILDAYKYAQEKYDSRVTMRDLAEDRWQAGEVFGLKAAVMLLAAVYGDHPDYDPAWA